MGGDSSIAEFDLILLKHRPKMSFEKCTMNNGGPKPYNFEQSGELGALAPTNVGITLRIRAKNFVNLAG